MARHVTNNVLNLTSKLGVHPHHLTKEHAVRGVAEGRISEGECGELFNWLDDGTDATVN